MKVFILLLALTQGIVTMAQVPSILNEANMPFAAQTFHVVIANTAGVVVPSEGGNQMWDYSILTSSSTTTAGYQANTNSAFPTNSLVDTMLFVNFIGNLGFYADFFYSHETEGFMGLGYDIPYQIYNTATTTGGANDSISFPAQTQVFPNPYAVIAYPTTENSSWESSYSMYVDFNLSIAAYGLVNVPCQKVSHISRTDTVNSWGTIKIPTPTGPSMNYPALLVKRTTVTKDSFYLAGNPAPIALLTAFGLSQGMETTSNRILFWRPEHAYPALILNFNSNNFTTPASVIYDGDALPPNGLETLFSSFTLFPNPSSGFINISCLERAELSIFSLTGKTLLRKSLDAGKQELDLTAMSPGSYIFELSQGTQIHRQKLILTH